MFQILRSEPKPQKSSTTDIKTSNVDFNISFTLTHTTIEGNYRSGDAIIWLDAFKRFMVFQQCKLVAPVGLKGVDLKFTFDL